MAINFNSLPQSAPTSTIEAGFYFATIEKAEMKANKSDPTKPPYLNLTYALKTKEGKPAGKLFDILSESTSDIVLYKIQRFITALEIPMAGDFELKDLAKIVVGKQMGIDISIDTRNTPHRPQVDVFSGKVYYNMAEATQQAGITNLSAPVPTGQINATDAADAQKPTVTTTEY